MNVTTYLIASLLLTATPALAQPDDARQGGGNVHHGRTFEPHGRSGDHSERRGDRHDHQARGDQGRHEHEDQASMRDEHSASCMHADGGPHHADGTNRI
ncbi:hypothetical protein [Aureimonas sp. SK2]|uniref:hypothetical protein n=1 Tax=Aureimonas sp. SK2 TaxID=3015992 RepID=UPI002443C9B7|nr:hypothetical protein [Aureimonas sp. SK2]